MQTVIDKLHLRPEELEILVKAYPLCKIAQSDATGAASRMVTVVIPDQDYDDYYFFLIDSNLATASTNFMKRIDGDPRFAERARQRIKLLRQEK